MEIYCIGYFDGLYVILVVIYSNAIYKYCVIYRLDGDKSELLKITACGAKHQARPADQGQQELFQPVQGMTLEQ